MNTPIVPDTDANLRRTSLDPVPGLTPTSPVSSVPSVSPLVSNPTAIGALATQAIGDLTVLMERGAFYADSMLKNFKEMHEQTKEMHRATKTIVQEVATQAGITQQPGYREAPQSSGRGGIRTASPYPEGQTGDVDPDDPRYKQIRQMTFGQGRDLQSVKANVAARTNRWMSEWGAKYKPPVNEAGEYVDEAGNVTREAGRAGRDWERGMSRIGRVQGVVNAVGEGEGLSGMIGEVGGRFAGPVGIALAAGQLVNSQLIGQRKANAFYQQAGAGGQSQGGATVERGREWMFSHIGTAGLMGSDEASQLFRGVSGMGLQGQNRQTMLDFATSQYRETGMDVATSLQLIKQATENGVSSMDSLAGSLDAVGEAAKRSGISLGEAQQAFAANYALASQMASGQPTASIAQGLSVLQEGAGQRLKDVNWGGMASNIQNQRMAAVRMGMSFTQYVVGMGRPGGAAMVGRGMDILTGDIRRFISPAATATGKATAARMKQEHGTLSPDDFKQIGGDMLLASGQASVSQVMRRTAELGLNVQEADIAEFTARVVLGDDAVSAQKALGQAEGQGGGFSAGEATKVAGGTIAKSSDLFHARNQNEDIATHLGVRREQSVWNTMGVTTGWAGASGKAFNAYLDSTHAEGKRYAGVEALFAYNKGQGIGSDTMISVKGPDGKMIEVPFTVAAAKYKEQLEAGHARITSGALKGSEVGDISHVYDSGQAGQKGAGQTNVTVTAKGKLADFIDLQVSGGSDAATARQSGHSIASIPANGFDIPSAR